MQNHKIELTPQQISLLLQIIARTTVTGEQAELLVNLKKTLVAMFQQKQGLAKGTQDSK